MALAYAWLGNRHRSMASSVHRSATLLHFFDSYSLTHGSLGAVIILLTWFYITGLMLLAGAEINSEIAAAVAEKAAPGRRFAW